VGYGRGFGAGFGPRGEIVVLGPSLQGHRVVRMARDNGRLLGAQGIEAFDEALVQPDLCFCVNAGRVFAVGTGDLVERWEYTRSTERYHELARAGELLLVIYTEVRSGLQGVLALDASSGERRETILPACLPVIHAIAADGSEGAILTERLEHALPEELAVELTARLAGRENDLGDVEADTLSLLGLSARATEGTAPAWFEILSTEPADAVPEASITADSGKLYVVRGALLEVRDLLSGRLLGEWTVPGLDEQIAFRVCDGAGLLAEEHRVSVFELPA
jgi:hypothetical protein